MFNDIESLTVGKAENGKKGCNVECGAQRSSSEVELKDLAEWICVHEVGEI